MGKLGIAAAIKQAAQRLTYSVGVLFRRAKFSILGYINSPHKLKLAADGIKKTAAMLADNPKKYIPAAKAAAFCVLGAAYITAAVFAGAAISGEKRGGEIPDNIIFSSGFVTDREETTVRLNWSDGVAELVDGSAKMKLTASVTPDFLNRLGITWRSSDEEIASVSADGTVTAKKAGTVYITAEVGKSGYSAQARLKVLQPVTGLFMTTSDVTLYIDGAGRYLKARIFPEDATNTELKWSSRDESVATVDSAGHVKPVGIGMTEVTARTPDGKFSCRSFVTVVNYTVHVDSVTIENGDSSLTVGDTLNLVASVTPYNAKNKTLTWSSSDESVVTVSQTGRVKAVGEGSASVSAVSTNGITAAVNVNVSPSDRADAFDLYAGETFGVPTVTGEGGVVYTAYDSTLMMMAQLQMGLSPPPQIWKSGGPVDATETEVIEYMNPANYCDSVYKYQFLDLSSPNGVSAEAMNLYLADKGILAGQGETFCRAAELYGVSEVYLAAHACLETGNGTSQLSTGVEVNGVTVYNMFGIGAYDYSALYSGSQKAYAEGWTSVEDAILGGAEWISEFYINSADGRQNTLYKMLWNPENPGEHQYATDVGWAVKQAQSISSIFDMFPEAVLSYDVPVYSGQTAPEIPAG